MGRKRSSFWNTTWILILSMLSSRFDTICWAQRTANAEGAPCVELFGYANLPCLCSSDEDNGTVVNCDGVTFSKEFPVLPHRHKIHSFSQSGSGLQSLEAQLFTASNIPLRRLDFSNNLLRRITERTFEGIEDTLKVIDLGHNKLGDQLDSVLSTKEFRRLASLEKLDLSGNEIKDLQHDIFTGLHNLQELQLEENELIEIPRLALRGLQSLKTLHLHCNYISDILQDSFLDLPQLRFLNLSSNDISSIENGALARLQALETLIVFDNQIHTLAPESFDGLTNLKHLDLSQNFIEDLPTNSLSKLFSLKKLVLHSNKIRSLTRIHINSIKSLEYLDLSRNRIFEIAPNSFFGMTNLKEIRLDVNTVRKVTNEMFVDLENLSDLTLNDNRILAFPTEPLNVFQKLRKLSLDYNRIAAVSREILAPVRRNEELSLAFNLISEIPDGTFAEFQNLLLLNLHGNKISDFSMKKTEGIEDTVLYLDIGYNEIAQLPQFRFSKLLILSLARNRISTISEENIQQLTSMKYLNVSYNLLSSLSPGLFASLKNLESLDLQHNLLNSLPHGVFTNLMIVYVDLKYNQITDITERTFSDLIRLKNVDLSNNRLENIASNAFNSVPNIEMLNLMGNQITALKGDIFSSRTEIHTLNLSHNKLTFLYPDAFTLYPKMRHLDLGYNELSFFPRETVNDLVSLLRINLAGNKLHSVGDGYFANMPNLRRLDLQNNTIALVGELAFQNSPDLHSIFLQNNQISFLSEKTFDGLNRLELDISNNNLTTLPNELFSRLKGLKLESINLAQNNFRDFPIAALKRQYSFLERANFSFNKLSTLPSNADVLVNIKELDISYNPLSTDAHHILFGEPKSARKLYAEGIGVSSLPVIESPFVRVLSLKGNKLSELDDVFQRTNMLSELDLSENQFPNLNANLVPSLSKVSRLRKLDLSENPLRYISHTDFTRLQHLRSLKITDLPHITEINCDSIRNLPKLRSLDMYGFRSLPSIHTKQCLQNLTGLEHLGIEIKDMHLKDQLQAVYSPRLDDVSVRGRNLRSVSSSAFAGMLSPDIKISLTDTSVDTFTDRIFLPLPLSSKIEFDVSKNKIRRFTPEMLAILDDKQVDIVFEGMDSNPIMCDCRMTSLWGWIRDKTKVPENRHPGAVIASKLKCSEPALLRGKGIMDLTSEELICDSSSTDLPTETTPVTVPRESTPRREHPYIIFEPPATKKPSIQQTYVPTVGNRNALTKVDTMIIGIVAGVVAFVCILIIIICIVRLRRAHPHYTAGPLAGPLAFRAQGKCTCLKPPPNNCTCYPMYPMPYSCVGHAASLPSSSAHRKMLPPSLPPPPGYLNSMGKPGRQRNTPYYVTYPDSDNDNK